MSKAAVKAEAKKRIWSAGFPSIVLFGGEGTYLEVGELLGP